MADPSPDVPVQSSKGENGVAVVTIDRPGRLNALDLAVKRMLVSVLEELAEARDMRVVILTGAHGVFVAGTDIAEMVNMTPTDHVRLQTDRVFHVLRAFPKPVIAAVERFALGGGFELALACDLIVAGDDAKFALPEITVGIMPGAGGTQYLMRTIGKYRTMKLVLLGEKISAQQAQDMGLVSEIAETGRALEVAQTLAARIACMPALAVHAIKETVKGGQESFLSDALEWERKAFINLFDRADQIEGMRAFLEKRPPAFTRR